MSNIKYKVMLIILFVSIFTTSNFTLVSAKGDNNKEDAKFYADLADSLSAKGKYHKTIKLYKKAIQLDPTNYFYYGGLGRKYLWDLKMYDEAIQWFQKAIELNSNYGDHKILGDTYFKINKYDDAIREFKIAIELLNRGGTYTKGLSDNGIKAFKEKLYSAISEAYIKKGDLIKAKESLMKAKELKKEVDEYGENIEKGMEVINRHYAKQDYLIRVLQQGGIILGFVLLVSFLQRRRKKRVGEITFKVKWGIKDIVIIYLFSTLFLCSLLFFYMLGYPNKHISENINFISHITIIGLIIYWVKVVYKQRLQDIGLKGEGWLKNVIIGVISIIVLYILYTIYILIGYYLGTSSEIVGDYLSKLPSSEIGDEFKRATSFKSIWFLFILVTLISPFAEELFFRGFVYSGLRDRIGIKWAIILSALFFVSIHDITIFSPFLFIGSIFLAWIYEKRKSLIPCISAHITLNLIWALLGYYQAEIMYLYVAKQL